METKGQDMISGSCLCGEVAFEVNNRFKLFHLCHCRQCQKISGSAHVSNLFIKKEAITWLSGVGSIQRYDVPGRQIASVFCSKCDSPVPYVSGSGRALIVPAGSLNGEPNIAPQNHIYMQDSREWHQSIAAVDCFERYTD
jgi:hypothetical protein